MVTAVRSACAWGMAVGSKPAPTRTHRTNALLITAPPDSLIDAFRAGPYYNERPALGAAFARFLCLSETRRRKEARMKKTWSVLVVAMLSVIAVRAQNAQTNISDSTNIPAKNPLEGNDAAIKYGMGLFRSRCADCHGMDARGGRSPDLTQVWANGRTDDGLVKTVKNGVTGTEMPANPRMFDHEVWQVLAYLRTLAAAAPNDPPKGNAQNGQRVFRV